MRHQQPTNSPKKIIVIGAGMGGLAVAARLSKLGNDVTIFEAADRVGGKCRTEWINGFGFDTGPSLLTLPATYRDLFLKTGKRLEHCAPIKPIEPAFSYHFHDGTKIVIPNLSHPNTVAEFATKFGEQAGRDWHNLLERAEAMWQASREDFIESELRIRSFFTRSSFFSDIRTIAPLKSLRSITKEYTRNPYIQKIIERYATYTGSDPRKSPAVLLTIAFVEEAFGAWHVEGGLGSLATSLETRLADLGCRLHLNAKVSQILLENGAARGIQLEDGSRHYADIVISNVDAYLLYQTLLPAMKETRRARAALRRATPSLSGFSLQLGLRGKSELTHHNVFFPENYDDEFDAIFKRKVPVPDPAIYICNAPGMTTHPDSESWFVLINAPRHDRNCNWDQPGLKESYAESIIDLMEKRGLTVRDRIVEMKIRTPADLERDVHAPGGAIYGTSSNGARSAFLRAKNRSPIKNLYCVGGSAHPGGGLPLVAISAEIVANAIVANEAE